MEAINCPKCHKLFMKMNDPLCPPCMKEEEATFELVRAYVKEHPNCSVTEASKACEVPVKRIMMYIRDGRLEASAGMASEITCSKCGKPVKSGRMCEKCANETTSQVGNMKNTPHSTSRVFTKK